MKFWKVVFASLAAMGAQPLAAQMESVPDRSAQEGEGPFDKLLIRGATVIEGTGAFLLEDREMPMEPGDMLIAPEGVPHGIRNDGSSRLLVLAILAPAP